MSKYFVIMILKNWNGVRINNIFYKIYINILKFQLKTIDWEYILHFGLSLSVIKFIISKTLCFVDLLIYY